MLLDAKANVDGLSNRASALIAASECGHVDVVNALIDAHADVNIVADGKTALHWACRCPDGHSIVAALLAAGALVDVPGADESLFQDLVYSREPDETLKLLIAAGADVNKTVYDSAPPLTLFACSGITACVKILLDAKADVNARDHSVERSPLFTALSYGSLEMIQLLLSAGADVTMRTRENFTCIHELVQQCRIPEGKWTRDTDCFLSETPFGSAPAASRAFTASTFL
jgi:ankyrin repeat protein